MTIFRQTADASDLYREGTGEQYVRIVSSTESGNFVNETKNGITIVLNPTTIVVPRPIGTTKIKLID
jgi:hypothetical protein